MTETRELRTVIDAAERAAAAGDYGSAEHLLREAAILQEARLGPLHPDLANTLNNLGVVCEITDKSADAELCYRRAYAIATAALEPDHTFVATSRKNLRDFCEARGKPFKLPIAPRVVAPERIPQSTNSDGPLREPASSALSRLSVFVRRSSRSVPIVALGAGGLALVVFVAQAAPFNHRCVHRRRRNRCPSSPRLCPLRPRLAAAAPRVRTAPARHRPPRRRQ